MRGAESQATALPGGPVEAIRENSLDPASYMKDFKILVISTEKRRNILSDVSTSQEPDIKFYPRINRDGLF